jgi:hypothetical protein
VSSIHRALEDWRAARAIREKRCERFFGRGFHELFAAQQWVEADAAGLRMEPRRLTQCYPDLMLGGVMRGQQALITGGAVALCGAVLTLYAYAAIGRVAGQRTLDLGRSTAKQLAESSRYGVMTSDSVLLGQLAAFALDNSHSDVLAVVIYDAKDRVLASSTRGGQASAVTPDRSTEAGDHVVLSETVRGEHAPQGKVGVVVDTARARSEKLWVAATMLAWTTLLAIALGLVAGALKTQADLERAG